MARPVRGDDAAERIVKKEFVARATDEARGEGAESSARGEEGEQATVERRALRSRYLEVKNLISDDRDDISKADSDKFSSIISKVESLHKFVQKPREQVADAEALLDIASTLVTSVKAHKNEGVTPSDFISAIIKNFGRQDVASSSQDTCPGILWSNIGLAVSHIFKIAPGCCTMIGPMNIEPKQRKAPITRKRRVAPDSTAHPEELDENGADKSTDTDKNMATMFEVLRKHRIVRLENLVLNRVSFAQTVENIFALSFLVKDGRVEIKVDDKGRHTLSPRNAPAAAAVSSGQVSFSHFVFRFDFKDWKVMLDAIDPGDELMPHRTGTTNPSSSQHGTSEGETQHKDPQPVPTTPIRKLSRNRGLMMQEESFVEDLEAPDTDFQSEGKRKKRRLCQG